MTYVLGLGGGVGLMARHSAVLHEEVDDLGSVDPARRPDAARAGLAQAAAGIDSLAAVWELRR